MCPVRTVTHLPDRSFPFSNFGRPCNHRNLYVAVEIRESCVSKSLPISHDGHGMIGGLRFARHSLGIPGGTCFEKGSTGPEALTQAIRLRGIMRKMETRRDAQRMSGMAQCLPAASTKTPPRDKGATTRRFPAADAA